MSRIYLQQIHRRGRRKPRAMLHGRASRVRTGIPYVWLLKVGLQKLGRVQLGAALLHRTVDCGPLPWTLLRLRT